MNTTIGDGWVPTDHEAAFKQAFRHFGESLEQSMRDEIATATAELQRQIDALRSGGSRSAIEGSPLSEPSADVEGCSVALD